MKVKFFSLFILLVLTACSSSSNLTKATQDVEVHPIEVMKNGELYQEYFEGEEIYRLGSVLLFQSQDHEGPQYWVEALGDRQELRSYYFFENQKLYKVLKDYVEFDPPIWSDDSKAVLDITHIYNFSDGELEELVVQQDDDKLSITEGLEGRAEKIYKDVEFYNKLINIR